jgi:prepilin-type N-terminal cleavage/methylation domain-containing protein
MTIQITNRRGFTLVELLMVVAIISVLAAMGMAALAGAAEQGRRDRAKAQIQKIDQLISEKWNSYRYRQLPVRLPSGSRAIYSNRVRLDVMRELQRLEMPDRLTDILDNPVSPVHAVQDPNVPAIGRQPRPALSNAYRRKLHAVSATFTFNSSYEQAECLYLILSEMRDGDRPALDFFLSSEVGDVDGDGLYEILDPWGIPIVFLRWAPGFLKSVAIDPNTNMADQNAFLSPPAPGVIPVDSTQLPDGTRFADAFDPLKADPRWGQPIGNNGFYPFALKPLIASAGPDKVHDLYLDDAAAASSIHYSATFPLNDPYHVMPLMSGGTTWVGTPFDANLNGSLEHGDNITNHGLGVEGGTAK